MRSRAILATVLAAAMILPVALSNHAQNEGGRIIAFDHKAGNEWWVEVVLTGQDAGSVAAVDAMDTGGPWVALTLRSWGAWANSFRIEPGHQVQFRATWSGGAQVLSCWFTHPAGVEQCGTSPSPSPVTPSPTPWMASFTDVRGNEWWEQAQITPDAGTVAAADVRINGGAWNPLRLQSWGVRVWAGSHRAVDGSTVQLRAANAEGAVALSECFRWIPPSNGGATPVACDGGTPPAFSASLSHVKGNNWWIEAKVGANRPVSGVDTRVDGGAWVAMALRNWGAWAVSTHAPTDSHVQFRVSASDGSLFFPPNGWVWPAATPWPEPGSDFKAEFENVKGNGGWVQVNVYSSGHLLGVNYRVDSGAWRPLARQSYGDWAAAAAIPDGSLVQFEAFSGKAASSSLYRWPAATPVPAWPQPGSSYVTYFVNVGGNTNWDEMGVTFRYDDSSLWRVTCEVRHRHREADGSITDTHETIQAAFAPPMAPSAVAPGDVVEVGAARNCEPDSFGARVGGDTVWPTSHDGERFEAPAWFGEGDCSCVFHWGRHFSLVFHWDVVGETFHSIGRLRDTDAPIQ